MSRVPIAVQGTRSVPRVSTVTRRPRARRSLGFLGTGRLPCETPARTSPEPKHDGRLAEPWYADAPSEKGEGGGLAFQFHLTDPVTVTRKAD